MRVVGESGEAGPGGMRRGQGERAGCPGGEGEWCGEGWSGGEEGWRGRDKETRGGGEVIRLGDCDAVAAASDAAATTRRFS
jgi:hypothetical protein